MKSAKNPPNLLSKFKKECKTIGLLYLDYNLPENEKKDTPFSWDYLFNTLT